MADDIRHKIITCSVAVIWLINGLWCKVLDQVPRHEAIVARILGSAHSRLLTMLIGFSEVAMAIWIFSGFRSRLNAVLQMIIIGMMNALEFFRAPDLLLWGRWNVLFAFFLILLIYFNEFHAQKLIRKRPECALS